MTRDELIQEFRKLPLSERIEILEQLWIEAEAESPGLLDWQRELLDARLAEAEASPGDWMTWEEAKGRLDGMIPDPG